MAYTFEQPAYLIAVSMGAVTTPYARDVVAVWVTAREADAPLPGGARIIGERAPGENGQFFGGRYCPSEVICTAINEAIAAGVEAVERDQIQNGGSGGFLSVWTPEAFFDGDMVFASARTLDEAAQALKDAGYRPSAGKGGMIGAPALSALFAEEEIPADDEMARLGARVRRFRRDRGWNTADAGNALGMSSRTIEGIEQGRGFNYAGILRLALDQLERTA